MMVRHALVLGLMAAVTATGVSAAPASKPDAKPAAKPVAKPAPAAAPEPAPAPPPVDAPPGEPPLFTIFRTICADHQGDLAAAQAEARRQGFAIVPPDPDEDPAVVAARTVLKREGGDLRVVVILTKVPPEVLAGAPNAEASFCAVTGPDPGGAVAAAAKAWIGMGSNSQEGNHTTFIYRQLAGDQRRLMADQSDPMVRAAVAAGEYRVFDIDIEPQGLALGLMTGRARTP